MISFPSEEARRAAFPIAAKQIFLGHAGVTALPRCVVDAMTAHLHASCDHHQEFGDVLKDVLAARALCGRLIHAHPDEIALLGPTSLGLSLFANGLPWDEGDEVVCYRDDYPANVYPWMALADRGVRVRFVEVDTPGRITLDAVRAVTTDRTRLVALASSHYLTGWRLPVAEIGRFSRERGILFSLDAIQTLGAFPVDAAEVDFLSADAHKWLLGPMAIGIVHVAKRNFPILKPTLIGAWNVHSPDFLTQPEIVFADTARRYEPGVLNIAGVYGMVAAIRMLIDHGIDAVAATILARRDHLENQLARLGFEFLSPKNPEPLRSGVVTARHGHIPAPDLFRTLEENHVVASLRKSRDGTEWLRFSPHFYNTDDEMDKVANILAAKLKA